MTDRTQRVESDHTHETREFGLRDTKGRLIGARATLFMVEYRAPTEEERAPRWWCGHDHPIGIRYGFRPHALRDYKNFGSSHGRQEFVTEAERAAVVDRYFRDAEKRARKITT